MEFLEPRWGCGFGVVPYLFISLYWLRSGMDIRLKLSCREGVTVGGSQGFAWLAHCWLALVLFASIRWY